MATTDRLVCNYCGMPNPTDAYWCESCRAPLTSEIEEVKEIVPLFDLPKRNLSLDRVDRAMFILRAGDERVFVEFGCLDDYTGRALVIRDSKYWQDRFADTFQELIAEADKACQCLGLLGFEQIAKRELLVS
jgi:hypothetical protein